ncbi:MAG: hypothetical protein ABSG82_08505 [Sedimentisphaerales bacterium]
MGKVENSFPGMDPKCRPVYEEYYGSPWDEMPSLLSGPREPMTPSQLLNGRLLMENPPKEHPLAPGTIDGRILSQLYVDTSACFVVNPNLSGEVRIALFSDPVAKKLLKEFIGRSENDESLMYLTCTGYNHIKGLLLTGEQVQSLRDDPFSMVDKREEIWDFIAEGDRKLIRRYKDLVFRETDGSITNRMGVCPPSPSTTAFYQLLRINSIYFNDANGHPFGDNYSLIDSSNVAGDFCRLIGVLT